VTPDEVQVAGEKPAYVTDVLPVLRSALGDLRAGGSSTYGALISRPSWMWGAEMGVNEAGVAIGNEAVFSRRRSPGKPLLGMDILRLALHFSENAADGAQLIQELVAHWGQGGDGGWKHKTEYSNSYLVQDRTCAWLVETSGSRVRCRRTDAPVGISNTYDGDTGWDSWPSLKRTDERWLFAIGARGRVRNELKRPWLEGSRPMSQVTDMFALLRTHGSSDHSIPPRHGIDLYPHGPSHQVGDHLEPGRSLARGWSRSVGNRKLVAVPVALQAFRHWWREPHDYGD
ncbi:MAG: hypothetical protein KAU31_07910, partial [Spirochaetaceae bacterium]|nr:hypothetical protein [Spirochaetaceae bacterium]